MYIPKMHILFVLAILFLGIYPMWKIKNIWKLDYLAIHSSIINHIEQVRPQLYLRAVARVQ